VCIVSKCLCTALKIKTGFASGSPHKPSCIKLEQERTQIYGVEEGTAGKTAGTRKKTKVGYQKIDKDKGQRKGEDWKST
jgi:hypothetical protein